MKKKPCLWKHKRVLQLPDRDPSKPAVLSTLGSQKSQRSYRFAIEDFIAWYGSELRLAFNKAVVLRYRLQLEARHLCASTINVRLAAVRRLGNVRFAGSLSCRGCSRDLHPSPKNAHIVCPYSGRGRRMRAITGGWRAFPTRRRRRG